MASFAPQTHQSQYRSASLHRVASASSSISSLSARSPRHSSSSSSNDAPVLLFAPPPSIHQQQHHSLSDAASHASSRPSNEEDARASSSATAAAAAAEASTVLFPAHAGDGTFSLDLSSTGTPSDGGDFRSPALRDSVDIDAWSSSSNASSFAQVGGSSSSNGARTRRRHANYYSHQGSNQQGYKWHKLTAAALDSLPSNGTGATRTTSNASSSWYKPSVAGHHDEEDSYLALSAGILIRDPRHQRSSRKRHQFDEDELDAAARSSQKRSNMSSSSDSRRFVSNENVPPVSAAAGAAATTTTTPERPEKGKKIFLSSIVSRLVDDDEVMDMLIDSDGASSAASAADEVDLSTTPRAAAAASFVQRAREQAERQHGPAQHLHHFASASAHPIETILEEDDDLSYCDNDGLAAADAVFAAHLGVSPSLFFPKFSSSSTRPFDKALRSKSFPNLARHHASATDGRPSLTFDDEYGSAFFGRANAHEVDPSSRRSKTPPPRFHHHHYQVNRGFDEEEEEEEEGSPWGGEFEAFQAAISYWRRVLSVFKWSTSSPTLSTSSLSVQPNNTTTASSSIA